MRIASIPFALCTLGSLVVACADAKPVSPPADQAASAGEEAPPGESDAASPDAPTPPDPATTSIDPKLLSAVPGWSHARESETEATGGLLFQPEDGREFPPSRFRQRYTFAADGSCEWLWLAPTDAHAMKPARCEIDPATGVVRFLGEDDSVDHELRIVKLSAEAMIVAP